MPGELFEIEGEKKKRVVWAGSLFKLFSISRSHHAFPTRSAISSTRTSEGFTMVPDTRMSIFLMMVNSTLKRALSHFASVQHEAHPDSHVPFFGHELRALQENGDICT